MKAVQWGVVLSGLFVLLLILPVNSSVDAAVACVTTTPITDGTDNNIATDIKMSGKSLVWFKLTGELFHHNLKTNETRQLGQMQIDEANNDLSFAVGKKLIAWIDADSYIQLYDIKNGTTFQLTAEILPRVDVSIDGGYVAWREGEAANQLVVHDMTNQITRFIGGITSYSLNQGRLLANGTLYDLAAGTQTDLGNPYFTQLNGDYVAGYSNADLVLRKISTGEEQTLYDDPIEPHFALGEFRLFDDYVAYEVVTTTLGYSNLYVHQISTGQEQHLASMTDLVDPHFVLDGRFVGFSSDDGLFTVHDIITETSSPMQYSSNGGSISGAIAKDRIAWVEYQVDENGQPTGDTQLVLRSDCGAAPTVNKMTPSLNILSGRSAKLKVKAVGDEPMTYQWYQGEAGDTTQPVGMNSKVFETFPLSVPTSFWVRVSNRYGTADSEAVLLTPAELIELVANGGFETLWYVDWTSEGWVDHACNIEGEAPISHTGDCAIHFNPVGAPSTKNKLSQQFLPVPYQSGDMLTLSVWMKGDDLAFNDASVKLKVIYADGTKAKAVVKPTQQQFEYMQFTSDPLTITAKVTEAELVIKYRNNKRGRWWIDDISVIQQSGDVTRVLPLP